LIDVPVANYDYRGLIRGARGWDLNSWHATEIQKYPLLPFLIDKKQSSVNGRSSVDFFMSSQNK